MLTELEKALAAEPATGRDAAAVSLARTYATRIDALTECCECGATPAADLAKLGTALLSTLESLGMTPRARKAVKADAEQPAKSRLDELSDRRRRKSRPAGSDQAAT